MPLLLRKRKGTTSLFSFNDHVLFLFSETMGGIPDPSAGGGLSKATTFPQSLLLPSSQLSQQIAEDFNSWALALILRRVGMVWYGLSCSAPSLGSN
jgi:hypothetical protein